MKTVFRLLATLVLACPLAAPGAETVLRISDREPIPVRREILGVNQLAYGKDSYGLMLPKTHTVVPELVEILKDSGMGSQRYPGGCHGTHIFSWKEAVGLEGKKPALGLMEFLDLCEQTGMMPVLGLSAFRGSPEEAVELLEFLNSPADDAHPWAKRRAELGHPEPYNVVYFEYGNESYHGNHFHRPPEGGVFPGRKKGDRVHIPPQEYARDYLAFRRAMKAADPRVKLGVVMGDAGPPRDAWWNVPIFEIIRDEFDFLSPHIYTAVRDFGDQQRNFIEQRAKVRRFLASVKALADIAGVEAISLANTEFNTQGKAHFTLTSALMNAEYLRMFLYEPQFFAAHYWQFINEGWGMVARREAPYTLRPNYLMMRLFSRHLLDVLLAPEVDGPAFRLDFSEAEKLSAGELAENILPDQPWSFSEAKNIRQTQHPDGVLEVEFPDDASLDFYHAAKHFDGDPRMGYRLSGEIRVEGMAGTHGASIEISDARGYEKTRHAANTPTVLSAEWTPVSVDYLPLADNHAGFTIKARRVKGPGGAGKMYFRNLAVTRFLPEPVTLDDIGATVTRSADGQRLAVVAVNRTLAPAPLLVAVEGVKQAAAEVLSGPSPHADNEKDPDTVKVTPLEVQVLQDGVRLTLPPHSLAGVLIGR